MDYVTQLTDYCSSEHSVSLTGVDMFKFEMEVMFITV